MNALFEGKVRVSGPGIEHGLLSKFQSQFICETRGAGKSHLSVIIRDGNHFI